LDEPNVTGGKNTGDSILVILNQVQNDEGDGLLPRPRR